MTDELKPVRCGCGGEAEVLKFNNDTWLVMCNKCRTSSENYTSKDKAITAWNRAMSKQTAKAEYSNIDGEYLCMACGRVVQIEDAYCCGCGARLEWK
jgi:hypothetical protein